MIRRLWAFLLAALLALLSVAAPVQADSTQTVEAVNHSAFALPHAKDTYLPWQQAQAPPLQLAGINLDGNIRDLQGISIFTNPRAQLNTLLTSLGSTVADYQPGNYVGTLNASAWLNSIGAAPSLTQASGAAQPIILPFAGQKYLANFGVNGNYVSTPSSSANNFTGSRGIVARASLNSLAPATYGNILSKLNGTGTAGFGLMQDQLASGKLRYIDSKVTVLSSVTLASIGLSAGTYYWWYCTHNVTTGDTKFYYAPDQSTPPPDGSAAWVQIGTTVAGTAGATGSDATPLVVSANGSTPGNSAISANISRAQLYNGIGGTLVSDFNASDWPETTTNGATAVSSTTGETWRLANTGTLLAQIVASPQLLFDGAAMYMQAATTLVQPTTVIMVGNQITWTSLDALFDGDGLATGELVQTTSSPTLDISAGTPVAPNAGLVLNTYGIVTATFNGASSALQVNGNAPTTGNAGAGNMGGFTLGANASGLLFGNLQAKEVIILSAVPSAAKLAQIQNLLNQIYHIYAPYASANDWLNELPTVAANDETYRLAANGR